VSVAMLHEKAPDMAILEAVGNIGDIAVLNNQVLVGIYFRPKKTRGGIILTDNTVSEDQYQSKVGLILAKGPQAFVDPDKKWFGDTKFKVGDWIVFRPSDGWNIAVNGYQCRMLEDFSVKMKISNPDIIY
jgi:co-chaperonin GroES (HSP10)